MTATEPARSAGTSSPADERYDELRELFRARLRSDQVRLTTLSAMLARAEEDACRTFDDIRLFAHRLRGSATIFESPEIAVAAEALENAAGAASAAQSSHTDAAVWAALEQLTRQLAAHS